MWHNRYYAMPGFLVVFLGIINSGFFSFHKTPAGPPAAISCKALPVAICDEFQVVTLAANGQKNLVAVQLNNGSYDPGGGFLWFKARKMIPGPCGSDTLFRSQLTFCCEDAGDTIEVMLRVYNIPVDTGGISPQFGLSNYSDCITRVYVVETVKPVIATLPNDTISCEFFLSGSYSTPVASDNCCLDTILKFDQFITYDTACKRGVVRRHFTAVDCIGNTASSTQTLTVENTQFYIVQFPSDANITGCVDYSPNALGKPIVYEGSCEKMNLTYIDTFQYNNQSSGLPCLTIRRTWRVFSWCHYSGSMPLTSVPNPTPDANPLSPANLPGPTVGPQGIGSVMLAAYNDPFETDYSTFWQQNTNGYTYTQIIRITDNEPPLGRIASPVAFCDLTINDPTLWEGGNWVNPANGSNDLPEGPTLLILKALDNCSVTDMSAYYELFLDLDNNGIRETLISSQNPPPAGSIDFGNLLSGGGEQRQFDSRLVGITQKYTFAMERVITGDSMTVRVRWNTSAAPTNYATPQFPYGHHKVVWHIIDKCGNETIFTHFFTTTDDCFPPEITCVPDITVDIPASGDSAFVAISSLVYSLQDNVTAEADIELMIEKEPFSTHFPENSGGGQVYGAFFRCADLGYAPVRVWARDEFGNTSYCQSIVAVDDPESLCTVFSPAISGAAYTMTNEEMGANFDLFEMPDTILIGSSSSVALGFYYFNNLTPLGNYFVLPHIDSSDLLNGVNTYDLILISRHILNLEPLNSPYKLIAADVNRSGTVTTFDMVTARKAILGTLLEFPGNSSWRIIPKSFQFVDPQNPFQNNIPGQINLSSVFEVIHNADFYCVKVGDVDWTATPSQLIGTEDRTARTGLTIVTGNPEQQNGHLEIPVYARAAEPIEGFQLELSWPEIPGTAIDFQSNTIPADHYLVDKNRVRMSWEFPLEGPQKTFELGRWVVNNIQTEWLDGLHLTSDAQFRTAAYSPQGESLEVSLNRDIVAAPPGSADMLSATPTPFQDALRISFNTPGEGKLALKVFDTNGRVMLATPPARYKDTCSFTANTQHWPSGIYVCRVETNEGVFTTRTMKL